jgi:hypothetical protein
MTRFDRLRERAIRAGALGNLKDAIHDLLFWPDKKKQILDDFERAIEETERINLVNQGSGQNPTYSKTE